MRRELNIQNIMASIFSKIVKGEIPSYKVAENDRFYAFLDINPIREGHTLVIPKREEDYLFDLTDEETTAMSVFTKKVASAIKKAFPCRKVAMAVLGLEVPHAHIHLVPINNEGDLDFRHKIEAPGPERMAEIAASIAANM